MTNNQFFMGGTSVHVTVDHGGGRRGSAWAGGGGRWTNKPTEGPNKKRKKKSGQKARQKAGRRAGEKAFSARRSITIESLPPENSMQGRSNSAATSRKMWIDSASIWSRSESS